MGAEENRLERRTRAGAAREDIAGRIDPRPQAGRPHLSHHVRAARDVGVGVGRAADAVGERAAGGTSEGAQGLDALAQPARVDTQALQIASFLTALIDVEGPGAQIETTARHDGRAAQATEKRTAGAHGSLRGGFPIRSSFVRSYCSPGPMKKYFFLPPLRSCAPLTIRPS